jgi:hypothetical protein
MRRRRANAAADLAFWLNDDQEFLITRTSTADSTGFTIAATSVEFVILPCVFANAEYLIANVKTSCWIYVEGAQVLGETDCGESKTKHSGP